MEQQSSFKDIFQGFSVLFKEGLEKIREKKVESAYALGQEILGKVDKQMAVESLDEPMVLAEQLSAYMMACENALGDLTRINGISYAIALKHRDVIGVDVTTANFNTQVSKKNFDIAVENIKGYLLIGTAIALAAGIGFLVFKLLSAKKEKPTKGKEIVGLTKEMNKATELFSSIDLSVLPKDIQDKYTEQAKEASHITIQRVGKPDQYIKQGFELEVVSLLMASGGKVIDDYCLYGQKGSWVVECHNRVIPPILENIETFIGIAERLGAVPDDVLGLDAGVLEGRIDAAREARFLEFGRCAAASGYLGNPDPLFEDWGDWLMGQQMMDLAPQLDAVLKTVETPDASEYDTFEKFKEKMGKLGERFEKAAKKLQAKFDSQFLNDLIAKLKFDLLELEQMRGMVGIESKAIGNSFTCKAMAAKNYATRVGALLDELIDEDMKKQIQDQISKAAKALPRRKVVTESVDGSGTDVFDLELDKDVDAEAYLALPEYEQAGYRYDPRMGYEGANLMAMESWSLGAKVAVGIGAAVAILGIGALIASTLFKRNATVRERHASEDIIGAVQENIKRLDEPSSAVKLRLDKLRERYMSSSSKERYPQANDDLAKAEAEAKRINERKVERNGQMLTQVEAIAEDLGDTTLIEIQRLIAISSNVPNKPYLLSEDRSRWVEAVTDLFEALVKKPTADLDLGRDPEEVLADIEKWFTSREGVSVNTLLTSRVADSDYLKTMIDIQWGIQAGKGNYDINHYADVLSVLGAARRAQGDMLRIHDELTKQLEQFVMSEKLIERFKRVEEESKGTRDAYASVLRRINSFKPHFAILTRMFRHEAESIENIMAFVDRFLKAYGRIGRDDHDAIVLLSKEVSRLEASDWAISK